MAACRHLLQVSGPLGARVGFVVLAAVLLSFVSCARNTVQPTGDGRLFMLVDMKPTQASNGTLQVDVEVENLDPVRVVIFDHSLPPPAPGGIDVTHSVDWRIVQGVPLDLVGQVLPGGSAVHIAVRTSGFDENEISFTLDGNTSVRLFVANPQVVTEQHMQIELTMQQTL